MHATAHRPAPLLIELESQLSDEPLDTVRITTRFAKATEPGGLGGEGEAETRVRPRPSRPENDHETWVGPAPKTRDRRDQTVIDPAPGWASTDPAADCRAGADEVFDRNRTTERATTVREPEQTTPARSRQLSLPIAMRVLDGMKLAKHPARLAELSRSVAFVRSPLQPAIGRRVLLRVAHGGGIGTAVGETRTQVEGTGFAVRILATTDAFRAYADRVCSFTRGERANPPRLREPLSIHVL